MDVSPLNVRPAWKSCIRRAFVPSRQVLGIVAFSFLYFMVWGIGFLVGGREPAHFWPAAGVGLATAVRFGWRGLLPLTLVGLTLVTLTGYSTVHSRGSIGAALIEAALGGWILRRDGGNRLRFEQLADVGFVLMATALAAIPAAVLGGIMFSSAAATSFEIVLEMGVWWLGDVSGMLLIAPVLLSPAGRTREETDRYSTVLVWLGLAVSWGVATGLMATATSPRLLAVTACLPMVVIAAARYGPRGATVANLLMAIIVVGLMIHVRNSEQRLVWVIFLTVSAATALSLGAVTAERDHAQIRMAADFAARITAERDRQLAETEKARAQAALASTRLRFAAMLEHSHDAIAVLDAEGRSVYTSNAIVRLTGKNPVELLGRPLFEDVHPDDAAILNLAFADCLANTGIPCKAEFRLRVAEDRWVWIDAIGVNHLADPAVGGVVVNIRDATERREYEKQLNETRSLLEETARLAHVGAWEYVVAEDRLIWSAQTYRIHEVTPATFTPTVEGAIEFYMPEARHFVSEGKKKSLETGEAWQYILPFRTATGKKLWVSAIGHTEIRGGKPYRCYGTIQDVTERVESARAIERSELRYRGLFESAPVAIWELDFSSVARWFELLRGEGIRDLAAHMAEHPEVIDDIHGRIQVLDVNQAAVEMYRATDKAELLANLHRLETQYTRRTFHEQIVALWNGVRTLRLETRANRLNGELADVVLRIRFPEEEHLPEITRAVVLAIDVTDQKRLEDQLRQAQKLEAVGRLAGGVAHDFNNLLTVINGFAELILRDGSTNVGVRELASHIRDAGKRAADLTRQLLAFSRKQAPGNALVDLAKTIAGMRPLLASLAGDDVRLVTRPSPVPNILADPAQIESVVMNLAVNARDAMPRGGTMTIESRLPVPSDGEFASGEWVVLSVTDTGTGIPEEIRPHLFEPFFTTKEIGKGTGLGLSTVYGIVTAAGGHIRYDTQAGKGTTFQVFLPAAHGVEQDSKHPAPSEGKRPQPPEADSPVILLVEDQAEVRKLSAWVLREAGFSIVEAESGPDALAKLETIPAGPLTLVTDVLMPQMTGRELADRVRMLRRDIAILFVSGYTSEQVIPSEPLPSEAFLAKPFSPDQMLDAVRALWKRSS
jgi:PAS domain S-box-containing protein